MADDREESRGLPGQESSLQESPSPHEKQKIFLSKEEIKVLRECNQESFWYRCVPFCIASVAASQYCVNKGYLKPNPRFGALFKNFGAVLVGYILGKFSYQNECRKKILSLPNSQLAETLRRGKHDLDSLPYAPSVLETWSQDEYQGNTNQIGKGLLPPAIGPDSFIDEQEPEPANKTKSYNDLRRQNREKYDQQTSGWQHSSQRRGPLAPSPDSSSQQLPLGGSIATPKNKYGDVWDE